MNKINSSRKMFRRIAILAPFALVPGLALGFTNTYPPSISPFIVPANVTSIAVDAIGGGGGGGDDPFEGAGGGAGGGYCGAANIAVTPAEGLTVTVGTGGAGAVWPGLSGPGVNSEVLRGATVLVRAAGGPGGSDDNGGTAVAAPCTGSTAAGTTARTGGNGGSSTTGGTEGGGGGGGGAGQGSNGSGGTNGGATNGGAGGGGGGGAPSGGGGGNGGNDGANGAAGTAPGGGGGGAGNGGFTNGGAGARGVVVITYRVNQTITFGAAPTVVVGGTGTVTATGGASGNPVTFTSTTPGTCTVVLATGVVTGVAVGPCTIVANQAGDANDYNAAVPAALVFNITAAASGSIAIPTLQEWALGLMSVVLGGLVWRRSRRSRLSK